MRCEVVGTRSWNEERVKKIGFPQNRRKLASASSTQHPASSTQHPTPHTLSVAGLLSEAIVELTAQGIENPRLDAELLLAYALGIGRTRLYTCLRDVLPPEQEATFWHCIQRRRQREPLQYITGVRELWSLEFKVDPRVLIPRPETEVVVETALWRITPSAVRMPACRILDVGTGSGCIAIALATELPHAAVWATDVSAEALSLAHENAQRHSVGERIRFLHGNLFAPLAGEEGSFDLIVSNPPYIVGSVLNTLQPEVRDWEPRSALDGGKDGLDFYRYLVSEGPRYLRSGGWLVIELGAGQSPTVTRLIQEQRDLQDSCCVPDYAGHARVAVARKR
jgi:release factor glutamine methyltransferase